MFHLWTMRQTFFPILHGPIIELEVKKQTIILQKSSNLQVSRDRKGKLRTFWIFQK